MDPQPVTRAKAGARVAVNTEAGCCVKPYPRFHGGDDERDRFFKKWKGSQQFQEPVSTRNYCSVTPCAAQDQPRDDQQDPIHKLKHTNPPYQLIRSGITI
jgi:hypothetical protein